MPLPLHLLQRLTRKVERAQKKHILDLEAAWDAFFDTHPYTVGTKDDADKGERSYYLTSVADIPDQIPLIVGDAVNNLRSALDHLAYHLMCVGRGSTGPFTGVSFPIAENAAKYKARRQGRTQGMRKDAVKEIDAIEPYGGGAGEYLWHLHCLNNIDKHRLLLPVWAGLRGHSPLPRQREAITKEFFGSYPRGLAPNLKGTFVPPDVKVFPLKAGDVLLTIPHSEMGDEVYFLLGIAFGEPKIAEGKWVLDTLHQMTTSIRHMIFEFDRLGLLE